MSDADTTKPLSHFRGHTLAEWRKIADRATTDNDWDIACDALRAINQLKGAIKCTSASQPE